MIKIGLIDKTEITVEVDETCTIKLLKKMIYQKNRELATW